TKRPPIMEIFPNDIFILQHQLAQTHYWLPQNRDIWQPELGQLFGDIGLSLEDSEVKKIFGELVESHERTSDSIAILTKHIGDLTQVANGLADYQHFVKRLDEAINSFINLDLVKIPAIIFTGTADELATVFENLNKTGTKLTKYQVFSASWQDQMLTLDGTKLSTSVLDILSKRYDELQSDKDNGRGLEIDGYDTDTFKQKRQVNLAEFAYALGALILNEVPSLYKPDDDASRDARDTIGFYALAIATGTDNRHLEKAIDHIQFVQKHHSEILSEMVSIAKNINAPFDRYLKKPAFNNARHPSKTKSFENGMNSDLKFLSYIAAMWTARDDNNEQQLTLGNLPAYFVEDDLKNSWSGSGDSKLATYYPNDSNTGAPIANYLTPRTKEQLKITFDSWLEDDTSTASLTFSSRIKCLATIHANCSYAPFIQPGNKVDFEHIIAKKLMNTHLDNGKLLYTDKLLCGGSIGNIMLLNYANNREKQTKNLWEDAADDKSKSQNASKEIVQDEEYRKALAYPSESDLAAAQNALREFNVDKAKAIIVDRGHKVMKVIAETLGK
ncbi:hypothetical protein, partial [Lacticaseibacillus zhaodongensis]|uniref:hypothetical protein n=1 Tax=Lacticaseibacillus zhaodongensis TaxID=2668065 RepID=UPI001E61FE86